ncbi:MobF family relaxase [Paraglaciecola hydrolytica]|uniref:TrwC relaxase domain-containing protein n=1 Tax=Paraglaciecola hydrolytica TaxID=1799789 RepID=A0A148KKD9_9ALTE|nr:MobF family relaxase [Paraglaciecola hydrolytica]KXI26784.1 hypothetical protein AX660_03170 [Paraglaciecola hydrolytica]
MVSLSAINNIEYYKNIDDENYYLSDALLGVCHGKLKDHFKLANGIDHTSFENILTAKHPKTGSKLFDANQNIKRAGWDLTFSAPKSVSLQWASSNEMERKQIENAQTEAVKSTIDYIERYIAGVKRGKNGEKKESSKAILAVIVNHFVSRELEPQIHSHTVIPNVTLAEDGKLMAIDSRKFYTNQKVIGAIYRSQLAKNLLDLGIELEKDGESFRLQNIPRELESQFSTRTQQIKRELKNRGVKTSASNQGDLIKLATRKIKKSVSLSELLPIWQEKITNAQIHINSAVEPVIDWQKRPSPLKRLIENFSSFTRQQLEYEILVDEVFSKKNIIDLKRTINTKFASNEIVKLAQREYQSQYTSRKVLQAESQLIQHIESINSEANHAFDKDELSEALLKFEGETGFKVTVEQHAALKSACLKNDFSIVQGSAGAGKSTVMRVVQLLSEASGKTVIGATILKKAAQNLSEETGIQSFTIAKIQHLLDKNKAWLDNVDILVIDEAGQVPSMTLLDLAVAARKSKTKLILTGEDKQLDAISHGGALAFLSEKFGCSRIETIQRQSNMEERQVVLQLREGEAKKAFGYLNKQNRLDFRENAEKAKEALVADAMSYSDNNKDKDFIILAAKWTQVNNLSSLVRKHFKSKGLIKGDEYTCSCAISDKVFELSFSEGDLVRFSKNDYQLGVVNGSKGTINKIIKKESGELVFNITLSCGRELTFNTRKYSDEHGNVNLGYAYASTVYSSQGLTINGDSFVLWDASMHRAMTYVAGSRHKEHSHWYFNKAQLEEHRIEVNQPYINIVCKLATENKQRSLASKLLSADLNVAMDNSSLVLN